MDEVVRECVELCRELAALRARKAVLERRLGELKELLATDAKPGRHAIPAGEHAIVLQVIETPAFPYRTKDPAVFDRFERGLRASTWWPQVSEVSQTRVRSFWSRRETADPALVDLLSTFVSQRRAVTARLQRAGTPTMPA